MNNIIEFTKQQKQEKVPTFSFNPTEPNIKPYLMSADQLVSYDIDALSIDELREHARYSIIMAYRTHISRAQENNTFKQVIRLINAFLDRRYKEELTKYCLSGNVDITSQAKALAFDEALNVLPDIAGTIIARELR
ncbi:hypothetical protein [Acinetobacter calcoaceticus]|uniref:hypothetical protein n=1 Tax=Acinetobacter calcoaceticus TaxID=471 RepID=UPI003008F5F3